MSGRIRRALVKDHGDVAVERGLDLHRHLGGKHQPIAVERTCEPDALLADLAERAERPDLKAAGVGEDGAVPAHKAMQTAETLNHLGAGAQPQMEGVAEQDVRTAGRDLAWREPLDRAVGTHRHKGRGLHDAVFKSDATAPRRAVGCQKFKGQRRGHGVSPAKLAKALESGCGKISMASP